jgi:hypothetical protein
MSAEFVDEDEYFDDDSDAPSDCEPLEELEESLLEEEVDRESQPKHVEMEFDDEDTEESSITEDWKEVKMDGDATITNDCVDSERMRTMKIHSKHVLDNICKEKKTFAPHDLESLAPKSSYTTALLHLNFGVFYRK